MKLKLALSFYFTNLIFTDSNGSTAADKEQLQHMFGKYYVFLYIYQTIPLFLSALLNKISITYFISFIMESHLYLQVTEGETAMETEDLTTVDNTTTMSHPSMLILDL
jgi:hypothetical protein